MAPQRIRARRRILDRRAEQERRNEPAYGSSDTFIEWASRYRERTSDVSWSAHERLFESCAGQRIRVQEPDELEFWLAESLTEG